jgi:hypothetical protein
VSFIVCAALCVVFCQRGMIFCVICVIFVCCIIVVPLPQGKIPFAVQLKYSNNLFTSLVFCI